MRENTPSAMPPCFDNWCQRFDGCLKTKAQKTGFRHYLGGLLGESERKTSIQLNLTKPKTVWVATFSAKVSSLKGTRDLALSDQNMKDAMQSLRRCQIRI